MPSIIEGEMEIPSQELLLPFQVENENGGVDVVYFKLICTLCGGTFFQMTPDHQKIRCHNKKCDAIPLVVPQGFAEGRGTWML